MTEATLPSTQPYLLRALHEWCCDNGFTPYIAVKVDDSVEVPREFVRESEILLNVSNDATVNFSIDNEFIQFQARFAGVSRRIVVPVQRVMAIYARENGQGMAFNVSDAAASPKNSDGTCESTKQSTSSQSGLASSIGIAHTSPSPKERSTSKSAAQKFDLYSGGCADVDGNSPDEPPPSAPTSKNKRPALRRIK